jgi:hypothetical protein
VSVCLDMQPRSSSSADNKLPHSDHYDESYTDGITDHPRFANLLLFLHEPPPNARLLPVPTQVL